MSFSFLTVEEFTDLTVMPCEDVAGLESQQPGFLVAQLQVQSARIASRLRKRYGELAAPYPDVVRGWLATVVTPIAYRRRGVNPNDQTLAQLDKEAETASLEIKEAADSETGLFDIPLRQDTAATGIEKGGPLGYSEPDAYSWMDAQRDAVRGRQ